MAKWTNKTYENGKQVRIYHVWRGMHRRCSKPVFKEYRNYGARGIVVCERWQSFDAFYEDAYRLGYADDLEIDRINNDGNYEPSNVRFVTRSVNQRNRRKLKRNTSGFTGVSFHKATGKYSATIQVNGKQTHLGIYETPEDAAKAYTAAFEASK